MARKNTHSISLTRKNILNEMKKVKIKINNLNYGQIIILTSFIFIIISLSNPWFSISYNNMSYGAFSKTTGMIGYLSIFLILINFFTIFSSLLKNKIKLFFNSSLEDSQVFITSSLLLFSLGVHTLISLSGLQILSSDVRSHNGIIFYLLGSFLFVVGAYINRRLEDKTKHIFSTNNSNNISHNKSKKHKNITKLPF